MTRALVSELGAIMLRHMLKRPGKLYYATGLATDLGYASQSVSTQLRKLESAGWLGSKMGSRGTYAPRRNYFFTPTGIKSAKAEVKTWEFTDA